VVRIGVSVGLNLAFSWLVVIHTYLYHSPLSLSQRGHGRENNECMANMSNLRHGPDFPDFDHTPPIGLRLWGVPLLSGVHSNFPVGAKYLYVRLSTEQKF